MLNKIINWLCFWKEGQCSHNYVVVDSTAKTYKEIIEDSDLLEKNPDIHLNKMEQFNEFNISYRGRDCYSLGAYNIHTKIKNAVCVECGDCLDNHKKVIDKIVEFLWEMDKQIEEEELAERMWSDNCIRREK